MGRQECIRWPSHAVTPDRQRGMAQGEASRPRHRRPTDKDLSRVGAVTGRDRTLADLYDDLRPATSLPAVGAVHRCPIFCPSSIYLRLYRPLNRSPRPQQPRIFSTRHGARVHLPEEVQRSGFSLLPREAQTSRPTRRNFAEAAGRSCSENRVNNAAIDWRAPSFSTHRRTRKSRIWAHVRQHRRCRRPAVDASPPCLLTYGQQGRSPRWRTTRKDSTAEAAEDTGKQSACTTGFLFSRRYVRI